MVYKVRKGYVVYNLAQRYEEGTIVPSSIVPLVIKNQSWKIAAVS